MGGNVWIWSWVLSLWGMAGLFIAGRGPKVSGWGWAINLSGQVLWVAYALSTQQYGFLLAAVGYGTIFYLNFTRWWQGRPKQFEVMVLTDNMWDPVGYRYTAEGYVEDGHPGSRPGYEFEHKGHRFVVVQTLSCPMGDGRLRWEAVDRESYVARNTL